MLCMLFKFITFKWSHYFCRVVALSHMLRTIFDMSKFGSKALLNPNISTMAMFSIILTFMLHTLSFLAILTLTITNQIIFRAVLSYYFNFFMNLKKYLLLFAIYIYIYISHNVFKIYPKKN